MLMMPPAQIIADVNQAIVPKAGGVASLKCVQDSHVNCLQHFNCTETHRGLEYLQEDKSRAPEKAC